MANPNGVAPLNLGLYFDRPNSAVNARAMTTALNVRISNGVVHNRSIGTTPFFDQNLDGQPVTLVEYILWRDGSRTLVVGTPRDLYEFVEATPVSKYLNRRYETGTVATTSADTHIVGTGTLWLANMHVGDYIHIGATGQRLPSATWYKVAAVVDNTHITLDTSYVGSTAGGKAYTGRIVFTGDISNFWAAALFPAAEDHSDDDTVFFTNKVDYPVSWNGVATQVTDESAMALRCGTLTYFKNMMIYGDLVVGGEARPASVRNSAIGNPSNVSTEEASELIVNDQTSQVFALVPIGDALAVYAPRAISTMLFVGSPLQFVIRTAIADSGLIAPRLVANFGDYHEFLSQDAGFKFDGVRLTEYGQQVWREVLRTRDPARFQLSFHHFNEENAELIWVVPLTTDSDPDGPAETAYVEHYREQVGQYDPVPFTRRDFPFSAAGSYSRGEVLTFDNVVGNWNDQQYRWNDNFYTDTFPLSVVGGPDGALHVLYSGQTVAGADVDSYVRFGRFPLISNGNRGVVKRVYANVEERMAAYTLGVLVWGANSPSASLTLLGQFELALDGTERYVPVYKATRYVEVEFATATAASVWEVEGYRVQSSEGGER